MRANQAGLMAVFLGALKQVLRELPDGATGIRVDPGAAGYVMVTLSGPGGVLVACTVAQRVAPPGDGRQLTIDDVIRERSARQAVADVPSPLAGKGQEPRTVLVNRTPRTREAPAAPDDGKAPEPIDVPALAETIPDAELGEGDEEYPDGPPYAVLSTPRFRWLKYRRALGDVRGGAHHGAWRVDPDRDDWRSCTVSRSQYDTIRAAMGAAMDYVVEELLDDTPPGAEP